MEELFFRRESDFTDENGLEALLGEFFGAPEACVSADVTKYDVFSPYDEDKKAFYLRVKVGDADKDAISVDIAVDDTMAVGVGKANRAVVAIPRGVDTDKVFAELAHGVLTVILPKRLGREGRSVDIR